MFTWCRHRILPRLPFGRLSTFVLSASAFLGAGCAQAKVLYVNHASTSPSPNGLSWSTAFPELEPALNIAASGDEVWVAGGVYRGNYLVRMPVKLFGGFAGTESARAERAPESIRTVLDGGGAGSVLTINALTGPVSVDGFTVTNASTGVSITSKGTTTLSHNTFRGCDVAVDGLPSDSSVTNSTLVGNARGVVVTGGRLLNNLFYGNGEAVYQTATAWVLNNTFLYNRIGVQCNGLSNAITSNIFFRNGTAVDQKTSSLAPTNNCTFGNGLNYVGIADPVGTNGNIEADPHMASPAVGGYHLLADSPCINKGATSSYSSPTDLDGMPRVSGADADIGADEFDGTDWTKEPAVVRVSPTGDDANNGATWAAAKRSISSALDSLWGRGGEVWVAGGEYDDPATLYFPVGLYGRFAGTEGERSQRGGTPSVLRGGEMTAALGIRATAGPAIVDGFTVRDNQTGILCYDGAPKVSNCLLVGNVEGVTVEGGSPSFANNTFLGNARGVFALGGSVTLTNCLIAHNDAGVSVDAEADASAILSHCCVFGPIRYEGIDDPGTTNGNIATDPKLVASELGDVHLQPGSPCIDAGSDVAATGQDMDFESQVRIQGAHVDIGADEADGVLRQPEPVIVRVSPSGDDSNDGSAWTKAKRTLQAAVDAASTPGGEVWAGASIYHESVLLRPFTALYGGFAGTETERNGRDIRANPTVITTDGEGDAVRVSGGHRFAILDGFTVRDSDTGVRLANSSARVAGNTFTGCAVAIDGTDSSPLVFDNAFMGNPEGLDFTGGAPIILNNRVTSQLRRSIAIWYASPTLRNNAIAGSGEAGLYLVESDATAINNTFTGHRAAVRISGGRLVATNNILAHNSVGVRVDAPMEALTLTSNCLFDNPTPYLGVEPPAADQGNITADPQLAAAASGGFHIPPDSPCVDVGAATAAQGIDSDIDGEARVMNGRVDIGADESVSLPSLPPATIIRVRPDGDDAASGETWETAKRSIQAAIIAATAGGEVWVAAGTYPESLRLRPFLYLYGGFAGTETEREARRPEANVTVLAGDGILTTARFRGGYRYGTLDGFTVQSVRLGVSSLESMAVVTGNRIESAQGSGVADVGGAASIVRNRIRYAGTASQGVYLEQAGSFVSGNAIVGPDSAGVPPAAGIYALGGAPTIISNVVTNSPAGINVDDSAPALINNTLVGSYWGVRSQRSTPIVINNIMTGEYGIYADPASTGLVVRHNIIAAHSVRPEERIGADGNISEDPLFVDPANGDFRLRSTSPAIDAGDDSVIMSGWTDADGQSRLMFDHVDIGAYETAQRGIMVDAALALRIAAGLHAASAAEIARLSPGGASEPEGIRVPDVVRILLHMTSGLR